MNTRMLPCILLLSGLPAAFAQSPAPAPDGPGNPPPPALHRMAREGGPGPGGPGRHEGPMGEGMRILPPGMWWKDARIVSAISLSSDQQKRIDDLFLKSRLDLIHAHAALQEDELLLQPILNASPFDQGKAQAQIDKIADTRANLEKTDAHMLLSIRAVLSPDQWTKLQAQRGREDRDMQRGPSGSRSYRHQQQQLAPPPPPPPADDLDL